MPGFRILNSSRSMLSILGLNLKDFTANLWRAVPKLLPTNCLSWLKKLEKMLEFWLEFAKIWSWWPKRWETIWMFPPKIWRQLWGLLITWPKQKKLRKNCVEIWFQLEQFYRFMNFWRLSSWIIWLLHRLSERKKGPRCQFLKNLDLFQMLGRKKVTLYKSKSFLKIQSIFSSRFQRRVKK